MLSITLAHNWLAPSMNVMHLHANLVQAIFPGRGRGTSLSIVSYAHLVDVAGVDPLLAFPSVEKEEVKHLDGGVVAYIKALDEKRDPRSEMVKRVANKWGKLEVVDAQFKGPYDSLLSSPSD